MTVSSTGETQDSPGLIRRHMFAGSERCTFCNVNYLDCGCEASECCVWREPVEYAIGDMRYDMLRSLRVDSIRDALAKAWDLGYEDGARDEHKYLQHNSYGADHRCSWCEPTPNPYREEEEDDQPG